MSMLPTTVLSLLLACCCSVVQSLCDGVSAPETTLDALHSGCNSNTRTRSGDCVSAYHNYCSQTTFLSGGGSSSHIGVSSEHIAGRVELSCIQAHWKGDVTIGELSMLHSGCNTVHKNQHRDCLAAIHRYCKENFGPDFAGISQEILSGESHLFIGCFKVSSKENVPISILSSFHPQCAFPNSDSDFCFSAASRYCVATHGSSGGITQEVDAERMTVACYDADYTGIAYLTASQEYNKARSEAVEICSLEFDVDEGRVLNTTSESLGSVTYEGSKSHCLAPLRSMLELSQDIKETSWFEFSSSSSSSSSLPWPSLRQTSPLWTLQVSYS